MFRKPVLLLIALGALAVPAVAQAALQTDATVQFGAVGSNPPAVEDQIDPSGVNFLDQGTVTFNVDGFHQPLLYPVDDGETVGQAHKRLLDRATARRAAGINRMVTTTAPGVLDADAEAFDFSWISSGAPGVSAVSPSLATGKYIMLCNIASHFQDFDMFGVVHVHGE